jgi:hypothetical protein
MGDESFLEKIRGSGSRTDDEETIVVTIATQRVAIDKEMLIMTDDNR